IDQFAGQIAGVSRLQRGIGETFSRTVGRNEVFEYSQTFAEIGSDGSLDNFAAGLCHQTTHTGELTHLLAITARTRINHEVNWVQFLAPIIVLKGAEHDVGDFVTSVRPDVDDLIVSLAVGNDALAILLFDGADLFVSILELDLFLFRNNHVRNSDRNTGFGRFAET